MKKTKINLSDYPTIMQTGASKGNLICGIGYNEQNHLGCIIRLIDEIKPGEKTINCRIKIIEPGNLVICFPKVISFLNKPIKVSQLKDLVLPTNNFTDFLNIKQCSKRFAVGEEAIVTKDTNSKYKKGDVVKIDKIKKYPDQRDSTSTYYIVSNYDREPSPKLDSGLDFL